MLKMHDDMIKDQLNKGLIESVDNNLIQGTLKQYIPHHVVVTPDKKQQSYEWCTMLPPRSRVM